MKAICYCWALLSCCVGAHAQFDMEESHTTASLRGIDSVGDGVAWASGSGGTVLRSEDGGYLWQTCAMPPGAEKLDFRGVQAFDAQTAFVMSSGKGALSKVFRTADGCQTWTLVLDNPDADGFFDALVLDHHDRESGYILGDPVGGRFVLLTTHDGGLHWTKMDAPSLAVASPGIGAFAASNSSLLMIPGAKALTFATGGPGGPFIYTAADEVSFSAGKVPLAGATESAGVFSLATCGAGLIAVGGEYTKPEVSAGTAAYFDAQQKAWVVPKALPGGYRSAVGYEPTQHICLAVGPTGVDLSRDHGNSWQALAGAEASGWNAISLPFVVGSKGRIGKLRAGIKPR